MQLEFSFTVLSCCIEIHFVKQSWCRRRAQANSAVTEYKFTKGREVSKTRDTDH